MAKARTVPSQDLRVGEIILINGKVSYSRLASFIENQELDESNARRVARGMRPVPKPYVTITLVDTSVKQKDPGLRSPEETYVEESFYLGQSGQNAGRTCYSINSFGNTLPPVLVKNSDGTYSQVKLTGELANDLDVTLLVNVFYSKQNTTNGIGLQQVFVNEPIRYYSSGVNQQELAARGIVISGPVAPVATNAQIPAPSAPQSTPAIQTVTQYGVPLPGPAIEQLAKQQTAPVSEAESLAREIARLEQQLAQSKAAKQTQFVGAGSPAQASAFHQDMPQSPWD